MSIEQGKKNFLSYDRLLFGVAAAWNLIGAAVLLMDPQSQLARLRIVDPQAKWLVRSLASSATAWGIGYLLIAIDSNRFRQFIWLGIISKTLFALMTFWAVREGVLTGTGALPGGVDLVLALLFAERLVRSREQSG